MFKYSYQKIETPFERDINGTKKLMRDCYRNDAVELLKDNLWYATEKIDGTNIGVYWDGHRVSLQGRTENAQIPTKLLNRLNELFMTNEAEEMFEQFFGEKEVVLFGEGYGAGIQKGGGNYNPNGQDFILFDVYFPNNDSWVTRPYAEEITKAFGIDIVPVVIQGKLSDIIAFVESHPKSEIGVGYMEGVVAKPVGDFKDRWGSRIITKIKYKDFNKGE